jgi:hypothetical protein
MITTIEAIKIHELPSSDTVSSLDIMLLAQNHHIAGQGFSNGAYVSKAVPISKLIDYITFAISTNFLINDIYTYNNLIESKYSKVKALRFIGSNFSFQKLSSGILNISLNEQQYTNGKIQVGNGTNILQDSILTQRNDGTIVIGSLAVSGLNEINSYSVSGENHTVQILGDLLVTDGISVLQSIPASAIIPESGAAIELPDLPVGYLVININGIDRKLPYY